MKVSDEQRSRHPYWKREIPPMSKRTKAKASPISENVECSRLPIRMAGNGAIKIRAGMGNSNIQTLSKQAPKPIEMPTMPRRRGKSKVRKAETKRLLNNKSATFGNNSK